MKPAKIVEAPPDDTHAWLAFNAWLAGLVCTNPFTVADAIELKAMIKAMLGDKVLVDVYTGRGDQVFVRVDDRGWVLSVV
jgi:hypothetical protein